MAKLLDFFAKLIAPEPFGAGLAGREIEPQNVDIGTSTARVVSSANHPFLRGFKKLG